jgi:hypothetical protein
MADTTYLKKVVEPFIREKLADEYGISFESRILTLTTVDAVSEDLKIVGAIKTAGGKTATGRIPSGKIKDSLAELYYLTLVSASERLLILTSPEFYKIMENLLKGRLAPGLTLKLIELSGEIEKEVEKIKKRASVEVSGPFKI